MACRTLVPHLRIEPVPPVVEIQSLNHWTTREDPPIAIYCDMFYVSYSFMHHLMVVYLPGIVVKYVGLRGFPSGSLVRNLPANAGAVRDLGFIPGSGTSPGGGNGNLLHYFCLENPMDRGTWRATVHRTAESQT